jgi:hypothetical protein
MAAARIKLKELGELMINHDSPHSPLNYLEVAISNLVSTLPPITVTYGWTFATKLLSSI